MGYEVGSLGRATVSIGRPRRRNGPPASARIASQASKTTTPQRTRPGSTARPLMVLPQGVVVSEKNRPTSSYFTRKYFVLPKFSAVSPIPEPGGGGDVT